MRFALAFFFGYTEKQINETSLQFALELMEGLKENPEMAGIKAISKGVVGT